MSGIKLDLRVTRQDVMVALVARGGECDDTWGKNTTSVVVCIGPTDFEVRAHHHAPERVDDGYCVVAYRYKDVMWTETAIGRESASLHNNASRLCGKLDVLAPMAKAAQE
jgi:hypothetical protein